MQSYSNFFLFIFYITLRYFSYLIAIFYSFRCSLIISRFPERIWSTSGHKIVFTSVMRHFVAGLSPRFKSSQLNTLRSQLVQLFSSTIQEFTLHKIRKYITFLMFFCQKKNFLHLRLKCQNRYSMRSWLLSFSFFLIVFFCSLTLPK